MLLAFLGIRVHYECGVEQCQYEAIDQVLSRWQHDHFAILFHGGGNIGDLYLGEQDLKINIMEASASSELHDSFETRLRFLAMPQRYPHIRMHIFPQSLKFRFDERIEQQRKAFAGLTHPLNSLAVRDVASFEFARAHFNMPNLRIDLTPDIVFFLGFRPDLREQLAPQTPHDLLFFRRKDGEGSEWYFAGGAQDPHFPVPLVERLEAGTGIGGLSPLTGDWIDEDLSDDERDTGHAPSKAWRRFMIGAEYLSRADFVILDRLHGESSPLRRARLRGGIRCRRDVSGHQNARSRLELATGHIVSLILGIPHILIDNNIGKLADYYGTWTHSCKLGRFVPEGGDQGAEVIKVYKEWVDGGKISGRDHRKSARR